MTAPMSTRATNSATALHHYAGLNCGTAGFFRRSADGSPGLLIRDCGNVKLAPQGKELWR